MASLGVIIGKRPILTGHTEEWERVVTKHVCLVNLLSLWERRAEAELINLSWERKREHLKYWRGTSPLSGYRRELGQRSLPLQLGVLPTPAPCSHLCFRSCTPYSQSIFQLYNDPLWQPSDNWLYCSVICALQLMERIRLLWATRKGEKGKV